jgi:hypothetical protein
MPVTEGAEKTVNMASLVARLPAESLRVTLGENVPTAVGEHGTDAASTDPQPVGRPDHTKL